MSAKRQNEPLNAFLDTLDYERRPLYEEIAECLSALGYHPEKAGSSLSFKHTSHSKQIAKMGVKASKLKGEYPFFALRFSACQGYTQKFTDIVGSYIAKYPARAAICVNGACACCGGEPFSHVYTRAGADGAHCGAYAIEIPDISEKDIQEIKKLIKEEHDYLTAHEIHR